ncbi:MAG TPA: 3-phosphoshikimate 1-carboxyvinyltransferase [Vicinamibacterales bacterium]|nr:3-phosphoshikimate 1-carboxyvinyltransferase [Vicinamibacterales bacterium]
MREAIAPSVTIAPSARASGRLTVPGDKSISHRYAMLAALADGVSTLSGYSHGLDCLATLACVRALGAEVDRRADRVVITGRGLDGLAAPAAPLDARNSGTTMRLLTGVLAAQRFQSVFVGDASLSRRPMRRIIDPLTRMGAWIEAVDGHAPLTIHGRPLRGITLTPDVPSAQVKSCLLLAGLYAAGSTTVQEWVATRDHTERALETFGVRVERDDEGVRVRSGQRLAARDLTVPGDISGAAFWCALAAGTPGGDITIEQVGLNPTRTAFLDVLRRAGAEVTAAPERGGPVEPAGTLRVRQHDFRSFAIEPEEVPALIDEIPALAALAAMMPAGLSMSVRGAGELRVKESDRISALAAGFRALGSEVDEYPDGFTLTARPLRGGTHARAFDDHRLAMAFAVAASRAAAPVTIHEVAVDVSYPGFLDAFARLTHD